MLVCVLLRSTLCRLKSMHCVLLTLTCSCALNPNGKTQSPFSFSCTPSRSDRNQA
jgi:hypothetical protein